MTKVKKIKGSLARCSFEIYYASNPNLRKEISVYSNDDVDIRFAFKCPHCGYWMTLDTNHKFERTQDIRLMTKNNMIVCCDCFDEYYYDLDLNYLEEN